MVERKQSVFYIENMQIDWIAGDRSRRLFRIVGRTAFGLLSGLVVGVLACIAIFLLLALTGTLRGSIGGPGGAASFAIGIILASIGLGGLGFGIAGIQAYALDSIPDSFRPIRRFWHRAGSIVLAGTVFGLISALLTLLGTFVILLV